MIDTRCLVVVLAGTTIAALPAIALGQDHLSERILELALRGVDPHRGYGGDSIGPDVIVGELMNTQSSNNSMTLTISASSTTGTEAAYGIGTTSCNKGDQELMWVSSTNQHPVIAQNIYRIKDGRFEQLGQSWLKHGFYALQYNACALGCQKAPNDRLGVGCSDPYDASLNAHQIRLGPRYQVNPFTGYFPYPWSSSVPSASNSMARRLRIKLADIEPAPTTTVYVAEGQYVAPDDAMAGNGANNASYRRFTFGANRTITLTGPTMRERPAIFAWSELGNNGNFDPTVRISSVNLLPQDGWFHVGSKATDLGNGRWQYEYAVQNLTSDRMGGSFRVAIPSGSTVSNVEWRGVDSHSGFPAEDATRNAPWMTNVSDTFIEWSAPVPFDPSRPWEGNGLRWATVYNFRFEIDAAPDTAGEVTLGLYKPGTPSSISASAWAPSLDAPCYANCDGSTGEPLLTVDDFTCFINEFAEASSLPHSKQMTHYANCDGSTVAPVLTVDDFTCFINEFAGGCP